VAAAGFYPVAALTSGFTACVPVEAGAGGVDFSTIANVEGAVRQALPGPRTGPDRRHARSVPLVLTVSRVGVWRVQALSGCCSSCPVFAAACLVLGAAAVYIWKKRISLAGLSVGVVS
jgi:hypothetical protein